MTKQQTNKTTHTHAQAGKQNKTKQNNPGPYSIVASTQADFVTELSRKKWSIFKILLNFRAGKLADFKSSFYR